MNRSVKKRGPKQWATFELRTPQNYIFAKRPEGPSYLPMTVLLSAAPLAAPGASAQGTLLGRAAEWEGQWAQALGMGWELETGVGQFLYCSNLT